MGGFTLSQQDLTYANSPRLHITPCYFDLGHKYIFDSSVQTVKPQRHFRNCTNVPTQYHAKVVVQQESCKI